MYVNSMTMRGRGEVNERPAAPACGARRRLARGVNDESFRCPPTGFAPSRQRPPPRLIPCDPLCPIGGRTQPAQGAIPSCHCG